MSDELLSNMTLTFSRFKNHSKSNRIVWSTSKSVAK